MLQRQNNPLNRTRIPERREQVTPGPARAASGVRIDLLSDDLAAVMARVVALEALTSVHADTIAAHAAAIAEHESRIAVLEAQAADHETRIAALEP
jgi:uncharacterized coiled-coil protein SlyX